MKSWQRRRHFLPDWKKAFKDAEESYNRVSRRVSDAQARLEALGGQMAGKERLSMDCLEERMQENRQRQSEARERLTGLEQEKSRLHHRLETNRMARERISEQKASNGRDTKGMDMGQGTFRYSGR